MESMGKKLKQKLIYGSSRNVEDKWFLENGSILLELIADCSGKSVPIRSFSSYQILEATNNTSIPVVLFLEYKFTGDRVGQVYNDIVLSAKMSCCLEFNFPVVVFENAEHGVLNERGGIMVDGEESILPCSVRLKIAKEIANAVTYLHMAFPKIIIHRVVMPRNIVLDRNLTPKFSDLSMSITLPEGKSRIEVDSVIGALGYLDPSYAYTKVVTEYTDVYSFGVLLMIFLTGKQALVSTSSGGDPQGIICYVKGLYEKRNLDEVIDPMLMKDITSAQKLELESCISLALSCCEERDEDRHKMMQVAKELKRIQTSF
ncbi:hypothetical protein Bca52824_036025 [Brassica carinata]|uniref:Protein kinase domain-containing protein n=1 Tax=Brassica carinata TaxID=52824 RepID=A0A8X7S5A6_BRACI|nr:hypothetical protein Bca52824_036025 [Brassica carinata]